MKFIKKLLGIKRFIVEEDFTEQSYHPDIRSHIMLDVMNVSTFRDEKQVRIYVFIEKIHGREPHTIAVYPVTRRQWLRKFVDFICRSMIKKIFFEKRLTYWDGVLNVDKYEFQVEIDWKQRYPVYELYAVGKQRKLTGPFAIVDILEYERLHSYIRSKKELLDSVAMPSGDLVFLTQGMRDVGLYKGSILPSMNHYSKIFKKAGFDSSTFHTVLDFGCGTGRQLTGWYADNPHRELYGVDYNEELISWADASLPDNMRFSLNKVGPPLAFEDKFFDCIYLISVFTHLSLENQFKWLNEFRRILKPGQPLLISLHGRFYMEAYRTYRPEVFNTIVESRYWQTVDEGPEGSNAFNTIHMPDFAVNTLFRDWKVRAHLPAGFIEKKKIEPSVSFKQDVYVITY